MATAVANAEQTFSFSWMAQWAVGGEERPPKPEELSIKAHSLRDALRVFYRRLARGPENIFFHLTVCLSDGTSRTFATQGGQEELLVDSTFFGRLVSEENWRAD